MNAFVLGFDLSKWQDDNNTPARPDFKKAKEAGAQWVAIRGFDGSTIDEDFEYNYKAAKDEGLLRLVYPFVDYRKFAALDPMAIDSMAKRDAQILVNTLRDDKPELGIFADWERPNKYWPALPPRLTSINILTGFFSVLDSYLGKLAGFYGNEPSITNLAPVPDRTKLRPLWMATWPALTGDPVDWIMQTDFRPQVAPWANWTFWQFTAHGDGLRFGMESLNVDLDVFNGNLADLYHYAGLPLPGTTEPEIDPIIKARMDSIEARLFALEEARLRIDGRLTLHDVKTAQIKDIL